MSDKEQAGGEEAAGPTTFDEAVDRLAAQFEGQSEETKPEAEAAEDPQTANPKTDKDDEEAGSPDEDQAEASEADDADGEADPEDEDDQAEEQSDFVGDDALVRLEDGTETTLGELKRGSMLQADYTRKTQELADQRKATQEAYDKVVNDYIPGIVERLKVASELIQFVQPQPPSRDLRYSDPTEFQLQMDEYREAMADYEQRVAAIQQGLQQTDDIKGTKTGMDLTEARRQLREAIPELNDKDKAPSVVNGIAEAAQAVGFTAEEIGAWQDPRIARLAHLAARARKLEKAKPQVAKKTEGKPPVQKPGKRPSRKEQSRQAYQEQKKRLRQTGSVDDAVEALMKGGFVSE